MSASYTKSNYPKSTILLLIVLTFMCLIVSKQCSGQIIIDSDVLKHLLTRSAKSYYQEKDLKLTDSIIVAQKEIISYHDSIISNQAVSFRISQFENDLCNVELNSVKKENNKFLKKVKFFKFTTYLVGVLGTISTFYFIVN